MSSIQSSDLAFVGARAKTLELPPRIVFGVNCIQDVGEEVKRFRPKRVLVISDKAIKNCGLLERITGRLGSLDLTVYHDVESEPTVESIQRIAKDCEIQRQECVIGVGGGSSLDTAKTLAALATNPGDLRSYLNVPLDSSRKKPLPVVTIPTTAGTGAEITPMCVVIDGEYKSLFWTVFPEVAVVDPVMTLTCPARVTAGCGVDALSHAVEGMLSNEVNPLSDSIAVRAVSLISENLRRVYFNGSDLEARSNMALASTMAGIVQCIAGTGWPGHMLAEAIGPKYGIPHGMACGLALPYVMMFCLPACRQKLALLSSAFGVANLSTNEAASQSIRAVVDLLSDVEIPIKLGELKRDSRLEEDLLKRKDLWFYSYDVWHPRELTKTALRRILEAMSEGNVTLGI